MTSEIGKKRLHSRLSPQDEDVWSIIKELAGLEEDDRRRLLRLHAEMRFGNDPESIHDKEQRRRLDVALGALTALEIAYETCVVKEKEEPVPGPESFKTLIGSEAFLRYVNAYLYFGVRFLAWRIMPPEWYTPPEPTTPETKKPETKKPLTPRDSNQQFLQLKTPPKLELEQLKDIDVESKFAALIYLAESCDPAIPRGMKNSQRQALSFLDGFTNDGNDTPPPKFQENTVSEADRFELWLRGLSPKPVREEELLEENRFWAIAEGLIGWAIARRDFYLSLRNQEQEEKKDQKDKRPPGGWVVTNPLAARFALADVYWISRLLKADVSSNAMVSYSPSNWLHLLRFRLGLNNEEKQARSDSNPQLPELDLQNELWKAEEVLRSVFDFVCDLIQNAVEITQEKEREAYEPQLFTKHPDETAKWRRVFDEELNEIERQRYLRNFKKEKEEVKKEQPFSPAGDSSGRRGGGINKDNKEDEDWMERIRKARPTYDLVGLSFSGGGIRSATFNLGVLQGLQELDLLRKIDFISTVSGGGFVGSWLVANVYRTRHWLGRLVNWEDSIDHLRRYSNYLAPRLGVFSADTWTMWASWARNAFLIQLTCLAWLWTIFLVALLGQRAFLKWGTTFFFVMAAGLMGVVWVTLLINLSGNRPVSDRPMGVKPWPEPKVWLLAILPTWCFSFLLASRMWAGVIAASQNMIQQDVLRQIGARSRMASGAIASWPLIVWLALFFLAFSTLSRLRRQGMGDRVPRKFPVSKRLLLALGVSGFCVLVLRGELKGILWIFTRWSEIGPQASWYAYVLGPPLVLAAHAISVVLLIGFCGRHSKEAIREWWTRLGAALMMFGAAYLAITTAAVFGPPWVLYLLGLGVIKWGSILGWIGTVTGGLLAGKSSRTGENVSNSKSPWLERLAKVGGFVFIVGAMLVASTALYFLLAKKGAPGWNWRGYWGTMSQIPSGTKELAFVVCLLLGSIFSYFFEINIFGLNQFYRFRLVRCYLGATRWASGFRKPQPFTNFDGEDDIILSELSNDPENSVRHRVTIS